MANHRQQTQAKAARERTVRERRARKEEKRRAAAAERKERAAGGGALLEPDEPDYDLAPNLNSPHLYALAAPEIDAPQISAPEGDLVTPEPSSDPI